MESLLEKIDPDFLLKLNKYKIEHMKEDSKILKSSAKSEGNKD